METTKFYYPKSLLTIGDAKTSKGEKLGYKTAILYMSPYKQNSKGKNLCAFATKGCAAACLFTAGRGKFNNVQKARINKSEYFLNDREAFLLQLVDEISKLYYKYGRSLVIRLNGTTDIPYTDLIVKTHNKNIFDIFPFIQFYDYTKNPRYILTNKHNNYNLTFSMAETDTNKIWSYQLLKDGHNVAAVFNKDLYTQLKTSNVTSLFNIKTGTKINLVDGDISDLRFIDPKNSLVMLKAKGDANKDESGFVINSIDQILKNI
jgi:hypothetical protein